MCHATLCPAELEARLPSRNRSRKPAPRRRSGEVKIPEELKDRFLTALRELLRQLDVTAGAATYPPGDSMLDSAEGAAHQLGAWPAYQAAWQMSGLGATRKQVGDVAWEVLGNVAPWLRKTHGLPERREDVFKWLWRETRDGR